MRMKVLLFFSILVGVCSLSTETKSDNSLLTGGTSTKFSRLLKEILNQESLVRFSTSRTIQQLMLDAADSKKKDDMLFEKLQNMEKELRLLKSENQKYKDENSNLNEQIHQLQANQSEYQNFSLVINEQFKNILINISHLQSKQANGSSEIVFLKEDYMSFSSSVNEILKNILDNLGAYNGKLKEFIPAGDIRSCFLNPKCYVKMNFTFDDSFNACYLDMYIKNSTYDPGKYVGIILCSPTRYHLFMSDDINGMFYNIADGNRAGEDHCELIGGSEQYATVSSNYTKSPITNGYFRSSMHQPFHFGQIGFSKSYWFGDWLECGVTIPDDIIVF